MYLPRSLILASPGLTHVYFRCRNNKFYFKPEVVKQEILIRWASNAKKHNIKIFDFIIMDNHAHLLCQYESVENLSNFMRDVNSPLARSINKRFGHRDQVIKDRFGSPQVLDSTQILHLIKYIYMNRYKIGGIHPLKDPYCSASWRLNPPEIKKVSWQIKLTPENLEDLKTLLSDYNEMCIKAVELEDEESTLKQLIQVGVHETIERRKEERKRNKSSHNSHAKGSFNSRKRKIGKKHIDAKTYKGHLSNDFLQQDKKLLEHPHSIGSPQAVANREAYIKSMLKEKRRNTVLKLNDLTATNDSS